MKNILVTGGAGFIGSNFVHHMLKNHDYNIINIDALTYAGNLDNLTDVASKRIPATPSSRRISATERR